MRIIKNPNRQTRVEYKPDHIIKNAEVERVSKIDKIKEHEKRYIACCVSVILIIFIIVSYIVCIPIKNYLSQNTYESGELVTNYIPTEDGIGNIITLKNDNVEKESYKFKVSNTGEKEIKYKVIIKEDLELKEMDGCNDKTFFDYNIHYSINDGEERLLNESSVEDYYLLDEDVVKPDKYKDYELKVWVDNPYLDNHYHGIIEVVMVEE